MSTHKQLVEKFESVLATTGERYWSTFDVFTNAGLELKSALQAIKEFSDYNEYDALRVKFMASRPSSVTDTTAKKQWSRLIQDSGLTIPKKPKSSNPESTQKADKRAAIRDLSDGDLQTAIDLEKKMGKKATQLLAEQKRRTEAAAKPQADKLLTEVESIIEKGNIDLEKLLSALKKGAFKVKAPKSGEVK